jgi:hypothetical protein
VRRGDLEMTAGLPRSRSGRIPQWVLDEAARNSERPTEWRTWSPSTPPAPRRRRFPRVAVGLALAGALVFAASLLPTPPGARTAEARPGAAVPTPGHEAGDVPLGTPVEAPAGGGTHAFVAHQSDGLTPVAYDPCRPIHYVMRPENVPLGGERILHDAVVRISEVTGLRFIYDGATHERPSRDREPFQPDQYGDRWAPVVVAWETVQENPTFATEVAGEAGSQSLSLGDGPRVFVTGAVSLDEEQFDDILLTPAGEAIARAIVLHELGHLVGLDHVTDAHQLMYPTTTTVLDLAAGDLTGLSALGRGVCVAEL